jgi:hypothetical protein
MSVRFWWDWHPRSKIRLSTRKNSFNEKVIHYYGCGQMGKNRKFHNQSNTRALYGMFMRSCAILGFDRPIVCSRHNIGGMGCNYGFNNLFSMCGVWSSTCIIQHTNTPIITLIDYGARLLMELGFTEPLNLTPRHNRYVLVMIKQFSKWLGLVPLLNCSNEGVAYAFSNRMLNMFGVLAEVFIDQGT